MVGEAAGRQGRKKFSGSVDSELDVCIRVELSGAMSSELFKNQIKIICVGACEGIFSQDLNIRHKNHNVNLQ